MKKKLWILLAAGALTLSGCGNSPTVTAQTTVSPNLIYTETTETPSFQSPLVVEQEGTVTWGRDQLEPELQDTYDRLNGAVSCHQDSPVEVNATMEEVQQALDALRMDHPEYFWFDGQASYISTTSLMGETMECELSYTMSLAESQQALSQIEAYVTDCLSDPQVAQAQGDYEKILGVYRYVITHTDYVASETDQTLLSVMTRGRGTCAGYARTFQYLMHRLNIPCTIALGFDAAGESHGWNLVQCEGEWYHVDVTWGDPVDAWGQPGDALEYTYFMLTDEEILRDHTVETAIPLPQCTATACNYYRKSGLQMAEWDNLTYENRMRTALSQEMQWLTVRFDDVSGLRQALSALIDNSGIITLFSNCDIPVPEDGITYSYNELFYEFSVKIS